MVRMGEEDAKKVGKALDIVEGNGAVVDTVLCWVDYRRGCGDTREDLVDIMGTKLEAEEINAAKKVLQEFMKDKKKELVKGLSTKLAEAVGIRRGHTKTSREIDDVLDLMELLDEKGEAPIYVMTSKCMRKVPRKETAEEEVTAKLDRLEELIKSIDKKVESNHGEVKREIGAMKPSYANMAKEISATLQVQPSTTQLQVQPQVQVPMDVGGPQGQASGGQSHSLQPPSFNTRARSQSNKRSRLDDDEVFDVEGEYRTQRPRRGFRTGGNGERGNGGNVRRNSRRDFIHGGDKDSSLANFAAPIDIFVAGINKGTEVNAIKDHMRVNKGLEIIDMEKTSHDEARQDSYRISVKKEDEEKALLPETWPHGIRVRVYRHYRKRGDNQDNRGRQQFGS